MMWYTLLLYITRDMLICYLFIIVFFIPDTLPSSSVDRVAVTFGYCQPGVDHYCIKDRSGASWQLILTVYIEAQEPLSMNQSSHSELSGQHPLSQRLGTSINFPTLFKCYSRQISSTLDKLKCRPSKIPLLKISAVKSHNFLLPNRANSLSSRFPHWTEKLPS